MQKILFFPFRDNPLCFVHVLLNALDMHTQGLTGHIILEGEAVTLARCMTDTGHFLHPLYQQALERNLFLGACRACASKLHATDAINNAGIPLIGSMSGHPAMSAYIQQGYTILTL